MKGFDRISVDSAVMNGQPCIKGTRLTVKRVLLLLAQYPDRQVLRKEFPNLTDADIEQALAYAAANLDDEILEFKAVE